MSVWLRRLLLQTGDMKPGALGLLHEPKHRFKLWEERGVHHAEGTEQEKVITKAQLLFLGTGITLRFKLF